MPRSRVVNPIQVTCSDLPFVRDWALRVCPPSSPSIIGLARAFLAVQFQSVREITETIICLDSSVTISLRLQLKSNACLLLVYQDIQHSLTSQSELLTWSPLYPFVEIA